MSKQSKPIKQAIRSKYAWPGGYPLYLVTSDGAALCIDCGRKQWKQICRAIHLNLRDGWKVEAPDINYEDPSLFCDHCGQRIESAYAEDKAD
jgi:hypothetical protein